MISTYTANVDWMYKSYYSAGNFHSTHFEVCFWVSCNTPVDLLNKVLFENSICI